MKFPNNKVDISIEQDCLRLSIQMIHPKWISTLLFSIMLILASVLIFSFVYFELLKLIGPGAIALSAFWGFLIYRIGKVACWHRYGCEHYIIADLAFSYQRSYGLYTSELKSLTDVGYQIGFLETSESTLPEIERKGMLVFYTIDPITKIESVLYESALEISLREYETIYYNFLAIRNQDQIDPNPIFLN